MEAIIVILGLVCVLLVLTAFASSSSASPDEIEEFESKHPGKCGVCAYHAFGIHEGFLDRGTIPQDHRCPEKWERWKGALH